MLLLSVAAGVRASSVTVACMVKVDDEEKSLLEHSGKIVS